MNILKVILSHSVHIGSSSQKHISIYMSNFFFLQNEIYMRNTFVTYNHFFLWLEMQQALTAKVQAVLEVHSGVDEGISFTFVW